MVNSLFTFTLNNLFSKSLKTTQDVYTFSLILFKDSLTLKTASLKYISSHFKKVTCYIVTNILFSFLKVISI